LAQRPTTRAPDVAAAAPSSEANVKLTDRLVAADDEEETTLCEESASAEDVSVEEASCLAAAPPGASREAPAPASGSPAAEENAVNEELNTDSAASDDLCKSALPERPDFTGDWLMVRLEGNMDAFMKECGVSFLMRSAASAARFGVGTFKTQVRHSDEVLHVVSPLIAGKVYKSSLRIDGTRQDDKDPTDGKRMFVTPAWEADGATLRCEYRRADTGAALPVSRRFLVGAQMCIEQTAPSGQAVKRYFERR